PSDRFEPATHGGAMHLLPMLHERENVKVCQQEQLRKVVGHAKQAVAPQVGEADQARQAGQRLERFARRFSHMCMKLLEKRYIGWQRRDRLEERTVLRDILAANADAVEHVEHSAAIPGKNQ